MADRSVRRKRAQYLFGTICAAEVAGEDLSVVEAALDAGFAELHCVSRLLNPYDPDSTVSRLNALAGQGPCRVDQALCDVVTLMLTVSAQTAGRYDPTVWPLLSLWRACEREQRWPTTTEMQAAVAVVGFTRVHVDSARRTIALEIPGMGLDFSSAVKGYALDRALAAARRYPVAAVTLNAGGQVLVWRTDSASVEIGIAHPEDRSDLMETIHMKNQSVATSNQNEPHLMVAGQPVGHLLDPQTGLPMQAGCASVTVVAPSGLLADMLSTAAFVTGPDAGRELLAQWEGATGYWYAAEPTLAGVT